MHLSVVQSETSNFAKSQIAVAGRDGANYQGVGCPHPAANIQESKAGIGFFKYYIRHDLVGDFVLDVGSGLGVDSFIAAAATGEEVRRIKICDCEVVERGIF